MTTSGHDTSPAIRLPGLDGLRGVAVLLVFAYHVLLFTGFEGASPIGRAVVGLGQHGWVGVDLFFVLSGFLITGILLDSRGDPGWIRRFYLRRIFRIVPAYYACLLVVLPVLAAQGMGEFTRPGWTATWLTNVLVAREGWEALAAPLHHFWSLAIEEQFYLVWPFLVAAVSVRTLGWLSAALIVVASLARVLLVMEGNAPAGYVLPYARMDGLAVGALLAIGVRRAGALAVVAREVRIPALIAAAVLAAIVAVRGKLAYGDPFMLAFGLAALMVVAGAVMVSAASGSPRGVLRRILDSRPLARLGRYSYAFYLWHQPIVILTAALVRRGLGVAPRGAGEAGMVALAGGVLSLAVSVLSWRLIEAPAMALRDRVEGARFRAEAAPRGLSAPPTP